MKIPKSFTCFGNEIKIEFVDKTYNNTYGNFCDVTNVIQIAKVINVEHVGDFILTEEQQLNTFCHEVLHVFQFYTGEEYSESQAQIYGTLLLEFLKTKE